MLVAGIGLLIVSYLLGCVNTAYYFVRWRHGHDIRLHGSGNAGARNAGRLYGSTAFVVILLADAAKGAAAVVLGYLAGPAWACASGLAAVSGHIWPFQLRGQGGKGMATALGMLAVLDFRLLILIAVICAVLLAVRFSLVRAGIIAFWGVIPVAFVVATLPTAIAMSVLAVLLTITHRSNLQIGSRV